MKLTDKRFWIFEAMMLLCGFLLFCTLLFALWCKDAEFDMGTGVILILSFPVVLLYFAICGIPTWLLYKGNSWLKLAGWLYLISSLLVIVSLLIFFYDWNPITANMRPADGSDRTYELIRVLEDKLVADPEVPIDKEIKSEADIEYQELCPFEKYAVSKVFTVDGNGIIVDEEGSTLPSYEHARIWLENVLDQEDPNWVKFQTVPYQATYSFVLSPLTDNIRLVRNETHGPMFKNVVPENEFTHITQSMKSGEEVRYTLILANVSKNGLQKVEFMIKKQ